MNATRILYHVTTGQPTHHDRPPIVVTIEGAQIGTTAAISKCAIVAWSQDDRPINDEWGDLAGVQFEMELRDPEPPALLAQLPLFTDYR